MLQAFYMMQSHHSTEAGWWPFSLLVWRWGASPLYNRLRVNAGYAIFPANRYYRSHTMTVDRLAPTRGFEPPTPRLGATSFGSCLVVRHASKCPQTRMNTGFFIELPVAEYLKISPNIGSFCTQIEPAIRQILDRFSAVTPNTGDSLELSYPII